MNRNKKVRWTVILSDPIPDHPYWKDRTPDKDQLKHVWAPGSNYPQSAFATKREAEAYAKKLQKDDRRNQYYIVVRKYRPSKKEP